MNNRNIAAWTITIIVTLFVTIFYAIPPATGRRKMDEKTWYVEQLNERGTVVTNWISKDRSISGGSSGGLDFFLDNGDRVKISPPFRAIQR